jgi:hypothetical protein
MLGGLTPRGQERLAGLVAELERLTGEPTPRRTFTIPRLA